MTPPQAWPFLANAVDEIVEEYGYLTDVESYDDGSEQRMQLRRHPVGSLEYSFFGFDLVDGQAAQLLLYANRTKSWVVPHWPHARPLQSAATAGDGVLLVDTTNAPFQDPLGLGPYALVWRDARTYEVVTITEVDPGQIVLSAPLAKSWAVPGTYVIPCRVGVLDGSIEPQWDTGTVHSGRLRFSFNAWVATLPSPPAGGLVQVEDAVQPIGG